jgi:hypothetical protein
MASPGLVLLLANFSDVDSARKLGISLPATAKTVKPTSFIYPILFSTIQIIKLNEVAQSETWIIPNREKTIHVCDKSITVQITGRQGQKVLSSLTQQSQVLVLTGGKWIPHDLW